MNHRGAETQIEFQKREGSILLSSHHCEEFFTLHHCKEVLPFSHCEEWHYHLLQTNQVKESFEANKRRGNLSALTNNKVLLQPLTKALVCKISAGRLLRSFKLTNLYYFLLQRTQWLAMTSGVQQEARFI